MKQGFFGVGTDQIDWEGALPVLVGSELSCFGVETD